MVIADFTIVILVLLAISGLVARSFIRARARSQASPELAHAMRLLDQVLASDDAMPQLPQRLRDDITKTVRVYYKEIQA